MHSHFYILDNNIVIMKFLILSDHAITGPKKMKPEMTELWEPVPKIIQPGDGNQPPSDAIVLFDGTDLSQWINAETGEHADWIINNDGSMTVNTNNPRAGIETKKNLDQFSFISSGKPLIRLKERDKEEATVEFIFKNPMKYRFWIAITILLILMVKLALCTNNLFHLSIHQGLQVFGKLMILSLTSPNMIIMVTALEKDL